MAKILIYTQLLLTGLVVSQLVDLGAHEAWIAVATIICLAYIMIEVGFEFTINKSNLRSYGWDYVVAMTTAACPWIFCTLYFYYVLGTGPKESLLIGRFAAPTSAGVLFAMLAAAGLGTTWLFRKARILAIFDDLDTILLMIPLQFMFAEAHMEVFFLVIIIFALLFYAYKYLHTIRIPTSRYAFFLYAIMTVAACEFLEKGVNVHLEVLLPAFVLGCLIFNPHESPEVDTYEKKFVEPYSRTEKRLDYVIKNTFMFLVGCSIPKIQLGEMSMNDIAGHVLILTLLSNIGKMFPLLCYRKLASVKERLALCIAMFPRGEVGAGVLLVAIGYNLDPAAITVGGLCLALNLLLTGFFIMFVLWLVKGKQNLNVSVDTKKLDH